MDKEEGYYKDPKTGELKQGSFQTAWKAFINQIKNDSDVPKNPDAKNTFKDKVNEIVKKVLKETHDEGSSRYMFFSNLQQMRRQCDLLLDLDESMVEEILENGHDWAQDHIAESKNNIDQVFDFLMNETKKHGMQMSMNMDDNDMMMEGKKKSGTKLCSRGKAAAKSKFKVYPSAYANGYGVQVCKGKKPGLDGKERCSPPYC